MARPLEYSYGSWWDTASKVDKISTFRDLFSASRRPLVVLRLLYHSLISNVMSYCESVIYGRTS